jgi:hypothetical protein
MEAQPEQLNQEQIRKPEPGERMALVVHGQVVECLVLSSDDEQTIVLPLAEPREQVRVGEKVALGPPGENGEKKAYWSVKSKSLVPLLTLLSMHQVSGAERRAAPRLRAMMKVEVWGTDQEDDAAERRIGVSDDLSVGGMSLRLADGEDLLEGTPLRLAIHPVERDEFTVPGIVRRHQVQTAGQFKNYTIGVEFVDLTDEDRENIIEILLSRYPHRKKEELM